MPNRQTLLIVFSIVCSYIGLIVQRVSHHERVRDFVPDELREVRPEHSVGAVLSTAGRIFGHTGYRVERRQLGTRTGNIIF